MQSVTWLELYYFEKYVLDVAIATLEKGGVTSKVASYQFLDSLDAWGVPKYPDRTVILPPEADLSQGIKAFIERNSAYLREPDCWLGTWIDPASGKCYLDITTICSCLEEAKSTALALSQGARRRIVALYNFKHEQTIYLQDNCC
jgi:hypothetical protein